MDDATKKKVLTRLRKIAGQVGGMARMVEEERYCVDVLLQVASAQAALGEAGRLVLRSHIETCVSDAINSGKPAERKQKINELMQVVSRHGCMGGRRGWSASNTILSSFRNSTAPTRAGTLPSCG